MIARIWRATASHEKASTYHRHFAAKVVMHLETIAGYEGASLLRREVDGGVEFLAVTLWKSVDSIRAFAALLTTFDRSVHNYEVVFTDDRSHGDGHHP